MGANVGSRLDTNTMYLHGLVQDIQKGEIKVPKFQRQFVWKEAQALQLLDSMAQNYPVGSVLLWKTSTKLVAERDIGDFKLPKTDDLTPTNYVLDGQQRLTVIYSCFGAPPQEPGFAAAYDLAAETFIEFSEAQVHIFPLRLLFATTKLLDFRTALKAHPNGATLQERLDQLIEVLTNYKLPVVTLKDLTVEEVCPIFERINSSGTKLSTYDLMVAATWSSSFDLDDEARSIAASLRPKGFGDVDGDTIIKCLSAIHSKSIKKESLLGLRHLEQSEMRALVGATREALLKAVDVLSTDFGVYSWDFLPYEALVVILACVLARAHAIRGDQVARTREWFWRSSFSERYRGASEAFISRDLEAVYKYVIDGEGKAASFGEIPSATVLRSAEFRSNNSRSRALILAFAGLSPRNITNGATIDTAEALSIFNKKQFHHIYPQAHLKREGAKEPHGSVLNICIQAASENNRISDRDPTDYLVEYARSLGASASVVFASNLLPRPDEVDYASLSYSTFLDKRSELVLDRMKKLATGQV